MVLDTEFGDIRPHSPHQRQQRAGPAQLDVQVPAGRDSYQRRATYADTHSDNFEGTPCKVAVQNQEMIALLADLQDKGRLDQAMVVLGTEFGRTARINGNEGRDNNNGAFAYLLAGAGSRAMGGRTVCRCGVRSVRQQASQQPIEARVITIPADSLAVTALLAEPSSALR